MRVNHSCRDVVTRLRDAPHPDLARVTRQILKEPFDCVVGIGALVNVLWPVLDRLVRADEHVLAAAHESAAYVLIYENESFTLEQLRRAPRGAILIDPLR